MFLCVRTTVDIADDVLIELKRLAAESRRPLRQIMEDALRAELARRRQPGGERPPESVITFRGRGVRAGVDLDSTADLLDLMGGGR